MASLDADNDVAKRTCPSREALADFALGKLSLSTIEAVGNHVEFCPSCQHTLESLDRLEDSFVRGLKKQPVTNLVPITSQLEHQLQAAEAISQVVWHPQAVEQPGDERLPRDRKSVV